MNYKKFMSIVLLFSVIMINSAIADSCRDQVVVLTDEKPAADSPARITMFLDCHAASGDFPEVTTLNYFTFANGKFCQSHRVCGNVFRLYGDLRVGVKWYFGEALGNVHDRMSDDDDSDNPRWNYNPYFSGNNSSVAASNAYAEFKIGFDKIDRYCAPIQKWECVQAPTY